MKLREFWSLIVWTVLSISMFLSGFFSGNVVTMIIGGAMTFAWASAFLTSHVKSEHRAKKSLEVISAFLAFGIIIFGYVATGSLLLGVMTVFIVAMVFLAFIVSYLLPRLHVSSWTLAVVKPDEKEKLREFAYDAGLDLGNEIGKGLKENWKRHVMAAFTAVSVGVFFTSLNSVWHIVGLSAFVSYVIVYYSLSKIL